MFILLMNESPCGVVANLPICDIVVSEFELQWRYYVHFQTDTLGKGIGLLVSLLFFYRDSFSIE